MQYTITASSGQRVTSIRTGKGKSLSADAAGVFTLTQDQVVELCKAGYRVTALSRKSIEIPCVVTTGGKGAKPVKRTLGTAQIVELFRKGYHVEPIRAQGPKAAARRKPSNEPTVPIELYYKSRGELRDSARRREAARAR